MGKTGKEKNADKIAAEQWTRYVEVRDKHQKYVEEAIKFDEYYFGDQWDKSDIQKLKEEGRPYLTLNNILPTINTAIGEQAGRKVQPAFKAKQGGSIGTANVLAKLWQVTDDENDFQHAESVVFADGLIQERGYYDLRMNYDENVNGEIEVKVEDPLSVIPDPDASSYDPKDWKEVWVTRWMSIDDIAAEYGEEAAEKIKFSVDEGDHYGIDAIRYHSNTFGDEDGFRDIADISSTNIRSVRVLERQWRKLAPQKLMLDPSTGETRAVPEHWDKQRLSAFVKEYGLEIIKKAVPRLRWTVTVCGTLLRDDWSPYRSFTIVPYFPYFRRGRPFGMARNLISPQDFINKVSSQELHVVNSTANSGWIYEKGALIGMDRDDLAKEGSKTGLVLEAAPGRKDSIEKIQPNQIPTGLTQISQKVTDSLRVISGVSDAFMGTENAQVSGVALDRKRQGGQLQLGGPFQNLSKSRQMVVRKWLELVQDFYTDERTFQITNPANVEEPDEEFTINQVDDFGEVLNDVSLGKYHITIGTAPARDSFDETQFAEALSLREVGVQIPDHHVIRYSHLAQKDEIAKEVMRMQGLGEPTPEEAEYMQQQQQLALAMQQAELAKLEGEVAELHANVLKTQMEAQQKAGGINAPEHQAKLRELEMEYNKKLEELELRRQLAVLSKRGQLDTAHVSSQTKIATELIKQNGAQANQIQRPENPRGLY